MRPIDAIHRRVMLSDALEDEYMHRFFSEWANRDPATRYAMPSKIVGGHIVPYAGDEIAAQMQFGLRMSETYFVGKDVMEVVREVSKEMPPEVLNKEDPPSTHGFMLLEEPWTLTDVNVKKMPIRAIMWFSEQVGKQNTGQQYGLVIWALIDFNDRMVDDYYKGADQEQLVRRMVGRGVQITPATVFSVGYGNYSLELADRPGTMIANDDALKSIEDNGDGTWTFSSAKPAFDPLERTRLLSGGAPIGRTSERVRPEPLTTFLQALWRFMQQELTSREPMHTPKTAAKHLVQRQLSLSPVSIIHLRRRAAGEEKSGQEWTLSHRFVVRGHWRRQWYPSEARHKSIYIRPHIKGPEDAPFLVREHVTAVVR